MSLPLAVEANNRPLGLGLTAIHSEMSRFAAVKTRTAIAKPRDMSRLATMETIDVVVIIVVVVVVVVEERDNSGGR